MAEVNRVHYEMGIAVNFRLDALAKLAGLQCYDAALPQDWVDVVQRLTYGTPCGNIVWCYDDLGLPQYSKLFGYPVALTREGERILKMLDQMKDKNRFR